MGASLRSLPDPTNPGTADAGSPASFETFYDENFSRVYTSFFLITGNQFEAEEIVQDAFLRVLERWDRVGVMESATGYVFRVAMNVFRNRYRRASLALRRGLSLAPSETDDFEGIEARDELFRLLRTLTPQQRAAVVLTAMWDFSADEAGKVLGVKPASVRSLTSRARELMKKKAVDHR